MEFYGLTRRRSLMTLAGLAVAGAAGGSVLVAPGIADAATTDDIKLAQTDLNGLAYNAGSVDGIAGPQTTSAATAFQSDQCLSVDGIIGSQTLGALKTVVGQVQSAAGVAVTGTYDSATVSAVWAYQTAHGLTVDGIAGEQTMAAMGVTRLAPACHGSDSLGARIVTIAKGELGTVAGANKCVPGKPYNICADWCAAFTTWVWRTAGINIPSINYVPTVYDWARSNGKWYGTSQLSLAQPGYMIIFGSATNRYHIGIVDHASGGTVYVISGNTQNPANSSQWGVYDKAYSLSGSVFYGLVHL